MIKKVLSTLNTIFKTVFYREFRESVKSDYIDAKAFYLDDKQKERLNQVGSLKRSFLSSWWLFKAFSKS